MPEKVNILIKVVAEFFSDTLRKESNDFANQFDVRINKVFEDIKNDNRINSLSNLENTITPKFMHKLLLSTLDNIHDNDFSAKSIKISIKNQEYVMSLIRENTKFLTNINAFKMDDLPRNCRKNVDVVTEGASTLINNLKEILSMMMAELTSHRQSLIEEVDEVKKQDLYFNFSDKIKNLKEKSMALEYQFGKEKTRFVTDLRTHDIENI